MREWIGRGICVVAGLGLCVAVATVLVTLVADRPLPHGAYLLIFAIPAVAVGQVWGIATLGRGRGRTRAGLNAREFFFRGLAKRKADALLVVASLCWLTALLSFLSLTAGGPAGSGAGCAYSLENHGAVTCVSRATYRHVGAAEQRFAAAVLGAFFTLHLGMAAAELARRRARPR